MRLTRIVLAMLVVLVISALGPAAMAQPSGGHVDKPDQPEVLSNVVEPSATTEETESGQPNQLPFTGADVTLFLAIGLGAIVTGTLVLRRTRGERTSAEA
jgi:hypothetical protein